MKKTNLFNLLKLTSNSDRDLIVNDVDKTQNYSEGVEAVDTLRKGLIDKFINQLKSASSVA